MNRFIENLIQMRDRPPEQEDHSPLTGGRLYGFLLLHNLWRLLGLSCLTVLLCIPIITLPAALAAFSRICFELIHNGTCTYPFTTYWSEFRQDFLKRLLPGFIPVFLPLGLGALGMLLAGPSVGAGLLLVGVCLTYPMACHLYLLFAAVALPVPINCKNAVILAATAGLLQNLRLLFLTAIPILICWLLFPYSLPLLLIVPCFTGLAICQLLLPRLKETVLTDQPPEYNL